MPAPKGHAPYPGCEKGGAPKLFTEEYLNELASKLEKWTDQNEDNIFIEKFCYDYGIHEQDIWIFNRENKKFSVAYSRLKTKQKFSICNGGLKRKFAHPMCALLLSCNHGMHMKTEQKLSGSDTDPVAIVMKEIDGSTKDLVKDEYNS